MRVWIVCAAVGAASGAPLRAQTTPLRAQTAPLDGDYAAAVQVYVVGHKAAEAAGHLAKWTPGQIRSAAERYLNHPQPMFTAAAALHLEIAVGVVTMAPAVAASHLDLGYLFIRNLRPPSRNSPRRSPADTVAFTERWCVAAASIFLMVNDSSRARPFINRGLQAAPMSPDLRLLVGIVDEMAALSTAPDVAPTSEYRGRVLAARTQSFMRARQKFEQLLADEPRLTRARIRLGRVLWLLDERELALVELLRAQGEAREPGDRYLAAMFLGAIYEQQGDLIGARGAYEAALAAAPASQAATVALGYLDVMAGQPDRAHARARRLLSAPPVFDEWWSYKNGGFETPALAWLRSQVWQ